jgi:2'-5' RNA ligase
MNAEPFFFIALLPPQPIQDYATGVKSHFDQYYNSRHAFNSSPHITLFPPFQWKHDRLETLSDSLSIFAKSQSAIPITLRNFGAFPPRVIFIDVDRSDLLLSLYQCLLDHLETSIDLRDSKARSRPYAPHMTVAFRDLTQQNFDLAWEEFKSRSLHFEFTATDLTLLKHDGERWQVYSKFPFIEKCS